MTAPLRAVAAAAHRCHARTFTGSYPFRQCELIAGHDGDHVAHGEDRRDLFTWRRTGRER